MAKNQLLDTEIYPKTLLVAIQAPYNKFVDIDSYFEEFENLVKTYGTEYIKVIKIKLREIEPSTFLTKGKLEEIKKECEENKIEVVIFSEALTVQQERNLEDYLNVEIMDRTRLILGIFSRAAKTAEGQLQVEIANLEHNKSRLAGKGIFMEQQFGVFGVRGGPGESAKEKEARIIKDYVHKLRKKLEQLAQTRETQRKRRKASGIPLICLIGYTNAGKSTILNTLTKSDVLAEDKLFATLDTTTRELYIDSKKVGVVSDTVGFIQQLPPKLIDAFKSTLSELQYANLLLHVIDVSDKNWESHIKVVHEILDDLEVDSPMVYVFNKVDKVEDLEEMQFKLDKYQPNVLISATSKEAIQPLIRYLAEFFIK